MSCAFRPSSRHTAAVSFAVGGDLSVARLFLAYQSGIFPWPEPGMPMLWFAPPDRAVIEPQSVHVSRSLRKAVRRGGGGPRRSRLRSGDSRLRQRASSGAAGNLDYSRDGRGLHRAPRRGLCAHSVETYRDGTLCGGLYGVSLGGCFFGESMFSRADNASKVAFVALAEQLTAWGLLSSTGRSRTTTPSALGSIRFRAPSL